MRKENVLPTDLLQYRDIFQKYGDFYHYTPTTLLHIAHFMSLDPVTGLNTINNILRIFKIKIPLEGRFVKSFTRMILTRELNLYFSKIRKEDTLISFERLEKFTDEELNTACYHRGIEIQDRKRKQKIKDLRLWFSISNLRNVPNSLLLFSRISEYADDIFEISEDEDEYEVLRRVLLIRLIILGSK